MHRGDLICAAVLIAVGCYAAAEGWRLGFGSFESPGAGFIAVWAGGLLTIFSAGNLVRTLLKGRPAEARRFWPDRDSYRNVLLTLAGPVGFTLLLNTLGFFLCTVAMMVFLLRIIHPHRLHLTLVLAVSTAAACLILFQFILKVQFPQGLIDFYILKGWLF
ncbi:MAG: tripartite tricarboxylate transporter TctB family protein [Desulfobacterales bacterium]|nr:tripartite tricarboxylate transporter TctB family protein [Desulfobacterales bacterium]